VGPRQYLDFHETDAAEAAYDGHHVQIEVASFSGPHRRLKELGLVSEESNQHQYRFRDIVDLDTRAVLFTIEHEVRSLQHPMHARVLVNRDPTQSAMSYRSGRDSLAWSIP
jgi:arginine utilization protein RocB